MAVCWLRAWKIERVKCLVPLFLQSGVALPFGGSWYTAAENVLLAAVHYFFIALLLLLLLLNYFIYWLFILVDRFLHIGMPIKIFFFSFCDKDLGTCDWMAAATALCWCRLPGMTHRNEKIHNTLQFLNIIFMKWGTISPGEKNPTFSTLMVVLLYLLKWKKVGGRPGALVNLSPHLPMKSPKPEPGYGLHVGLGAPALVCLGWGKELCLSSRLRRHLHRGSLGATYILKCLMWGLYLPLAFSFYDYVSKENFTVCAGCLSPLFHHHQNHRLPLLYPVSAYKTPS